MGRQQEEKENLLAEHINTFIVAKRGILSLTDQLTKTIHRN